jgi:hypothetical protein
MPGYRVLEQRDRHDGQQHSSRLHRSASLQSSRVTTTQWESNPFGWLYTGRQGTEGAPVKPYLEPCPARASTRGSMPRLHAR